MSRKSCNELETCVVCGMELDIPKDTHLVNRENYIEGAGQLCQKCKESIYGKQ